MQTPGRKSGFATVLFAVTHAAYGLSPQLAITQYDHTVWTRRESVGLAPISAIAQTADGYLWLSTQSGLFRFDGVRFIAWRANPGEALPRGPIRALRGLSDGSLWIGTPFGISRLQHGKLKSISPGGGQPDMGAVTFLEDHRGRLVIGDSHDGVVRLGVAGNGGITVTESRRDSRSATLLSLYEDEQHRLWVGTNHGLCRWQAEEPEPCAPGLPAPVITMVEDSQGGLLIAEGNRQGILRLKDGKLTPVVKSGEPAHFGPRVLLRDSNGNVWLGTLGQGLFRMHDGKLDHFTRREGLSSDIIQTLFEDREGNLWVGTSNGLDRFRDLEVSRFTTLEGLSGDLVTAVRAISDGSVWVGTAGRGLNRVTERGADRYDLPGAFEGATVLSLFEDHAKQLWAGTTAGLLYGTNGHFQQKLAADGSKLERVFSITGDGNGVVWLQDQKRGLLRMRAGRIEPAQLAGLPDRKDAFQILPGRNGALWIGYYRGGVASIKDGQARLFGPKDGLAGGAVLALYEDAEGTVWAGTEMGLSRFREGRWVTWTSQQGIPDGGVHSIIEAGQGKLVLTNSDGLVLLPLAAIREGPARPLGADLQAVTEGIDFGAGGKMANPQVTKSADGRLWFSSEDGVAVFDPKFVRRVANPPHVVIESLYADGKPEPVDSGRELEFRSRQTFIEFTALSLAAPENIRFRYMLEGLDQDWKDGGNRRNITYTNLAPGHYRFRAQASHANGAWSLDTAGLAFQIGAQFYQQTWFLFACLVAGTLAAWAALRVREHNRRVKFQLVAEERSRLTRELHDTLLQGFAGVIYQVEAARRSLTDGPGSQILDRALRRADQALTEARQTLSFVRLSSVENRSLPESLGEAGKQVIDGRPISFVVEVDGAPRDFAYRIQHNLYVLAREAISNAVTHGNPGVILVMFHYSTDGLRLTIRDDGSGFDVEEAAKKNRIGLVSMRERAQQIRGAFTITSKPGFGTDVAVTVKEERRALRP